MAERPLPFSPSAIVWVEETLFLLRERAEGRQMFGIDMPFETVIDVGNTSRLVAFTPHDTGMRYSATTSLLTRFFVEIPSPNYSISIFNPIFLGESINQLLFL